MVLKQIVTKQSINKQSQVSTQKTAQKPTQKPTPHLVKKNTHSKPLIKSKASKVIKFNSRTSPDLNNNFKKSHTLSGVTVEKLIIDINDILNKCYKINTKEYEVYYFNSKLECSIIFIYACIQSFYKFIQQVPNIIYAENNDNTLYSYLKSLEMRNIITLTCIKPNIYGSFISGDIKKEINERTCLIITSEVNHAFGSINDIKQITADAHLHKVPVFVDMQYIFGFYSINLPQKDIDAFILDFSILGVLDSSILCIKKELLNGYRLVSNIFSNPKTNTLTLSIIYESLKIISDNIKSRTKYINELYKYMMKQMEKRLKLKYIDGDQNNNQNNNQNSDQLIIKLGYHIDNYVPNSFVLSMPQSFNIDLLNNAYIFVDEITYINNHTSYKNLIGISINEFNKKEEVDMLIDVLTKCI